MTPKIIDTYKEGDAVPSWLIDVDPNSNDSIKGEATFQSECIVLEAWGEYVILPKDKTRPPILFTGGRQNTIFASERNVVIPTCFQTMKIKP